MEETIVDKIWVCVIAFGILSSLLLVALDKASVVIYYSMMAFALGAYTQREFFNKR